MGLVTQGELCKTRSLCAGAIIKYLLFSKVFYFDLAFPIGIIASCVTLQLTGFRAGRCPVIQEIGV